MKGWRWKYGGKKRVRGSGEKRREDFVGACGAGCPVIPLAKAQRTQRTQREERLRGLAIPIEVWYYSK